MLRVLVSRVGQMAFVMAGISILVFLIFFATPGADPAARIAGRNASPATRCAPRSSPSCRCSGSISASWSAGAPC